MAIRRELNESIVRRVCRTAGHLFLHPFQALRWAQDRLSSQTPLDRELPWFSWHAIDFLESWLQPSHRVLELGSGGSTLFFAKRVKSVMAIEDDPIWARRLTSALEEKGITNVCLKLLQSDVSDAGRFLASPYLKAVPDERFDLIVIDGPERFPQLDLRPTAFDWAASKLAPGGLLLLDDSWRYPDSGLVLAGKTVLRFAGFGPCRMGVTETAIVRT